MRRALALVAAAFASGFMAQPAATESTAMPFVVEIANEADRPVHVEVRLVGEDGVTRAGPIGVGARAHAVESRSLFPAATTFRVVARAGDAGYESPLVDLDACPETTVARLRVALDADAAWSVRAKAPACERLSPS